MHEWTPFNIRTCTHALPPWASANTSMHSEWENIILKHAMQHESFADNTQLQLFGYFTQIPNMIKITEDCIFDLKLWMTPTNSNWMMIKLKSCFLHPKTTTTTKLQQPPLLLQSMSVNNATIKFSSSVCELGVIFYNTLSFKQHISNLSVR